jgi:hypothetical protein
MGIFKTLASGQIHGQNSLASSVTLLPFQPHVMKRMKHVIQFFYVHFQNCDFSMISVSILVWQDLRSLILKSLHPFD